jgi:hypothetical protein
LLRLRFTNPAHRNIGAYMPRKRYKLGGGNIKVETGYDPFPKSGLVKRYEPFIKKRVGEFCKKYTWLRRDELLIEAVRLASKAEQKFKPELGNDFSTFLDPYLKGLHRFAEQEARLRRVNVSFVDDGFQKAQEAEETKEAKTPAGEFLGGANGARLTIDSQSMDGAGTRRRTVVRVQLGSVEADRVRWLVGRASPDTKILADMKSDASVRLAYIRAVLDHHERRQDEIEQETENQERGIFEPVFLEARSKTGGVDVKQCKGREPPRFHPDYLPVVSLDDAYRHDDGWGRQSL